MNQNIILSAIMSFSFFLSPTSLADPETSTKDGILLSVTLSMKEGKRLVSCQLTNNSKHPICTGSFLYRNVYYAMLKDKEGKELPQDEEWASRYAQKSSNAYKHPRSISGFQVNPGDSVKFDFFLEDAYPGSSLAKAEKLEISWESKYQGPDKDFDGNPYHFPPEWTISTSISLEEEGKRD